MNLLSMPVEEEEEEKEEEQQHGHRTRQWNDLLPPSPGSGAAEQKVLRELIEKNAVKERRMKRCLVRYTIAAALLTATVVISFASTSAHPPVITDNPALVTPTTSHEFSQRAEALVRLGRYEEALMDYSCLARLNQDSRKAHEGIALCYVETGKNAEAIEKLNDILSRYPDSSFAHKLRGDCYRNMHEFDKARADYSWLLQHDQNCSAAYCSMTDILRMEGKSEEALLCVSTAINKKVDNFETRQRRAEILVALGKYAEAQKDFELINKMPSKQENASTLTSRAKAYMATRDYESAIKALDKLITLRPKHVAPYMERAKAQFGLELYSKASKDCDRVLNLSGENLDALMLRADCESQLGDHIAALHDYELVVSKNPRLTKGILKLASYQMSRSNFASALESYRSALNNDANCAEALLGCKKAKRELDALAGEAQIASTKTPGRFVCDQTVIKEIESLSFNDALAKGYSALQEGHGELACQILKRAVQLQPNSAEARRYLAVALMESADPVNAERQLQALKQLNHEEPSYNIRLAVAFQKIGKDDKAIEILRNHVSQHKTDVDAIVLLTDALLAANERPSALKLCEQTLQAVSSPKDQKRLREKYMAMKNSDRIEPEMKTQPAVDTSPLESRGS